MRHITKEIDVHLMRRNQRYAKEGTPSKEPEGKNRKEGTRRNEPEGRNPKEGTLRKEPEGRNPN